MQTIGKVQLEHYDNAMSCLTMVIKGVSKKARQDTRRDKCTDIGRTAPPTPWEVNAVMRKASPLVRMIVDRCVASLPSAVKFRPRYSHHGKLPVGLVEHVLTSSSTNIFLSTLCDPSQLMELEVTSIYSDTHDK
jgi:hypothetical protein